MVAVTSDFTITARAPRRAVADAMSNLRAAFSARLEKGRAYRQMLRELQSYSHRNLLDMGIDAYNLEGFARRACGL